MNESSKTIAFVSVAVLMVGLAFASHFMNRPKVQRDFELVGQPFFEDFTSSEQARSLEVAAVDAESLSLQRFSVENEDGLWRIPSHHGYPAEAAVRLAETATSVIGIERETLAGRLASDHEKLGVVDPLSDEFEDPEAAGKRITLKDGDGEVLVDYIIGKEAGEVVLSEARRQLAEGGVPEKYFYVRRPDEQQTYKVKLNIDLSTRFSDWIDPDLLRLDRNKLTRILIDNYTLEEERANPLGPVKSLFKSQGDQLALSRDEGNNSWELADLDADNEELQPTRINGIINVLSSMRIAGVRPKFKYKDHLLLTPDLKLNRLPEFEKDPQEFGRAINQLQDELDDKGFNLAGSSEKLELVSQQGQLDIGTNDGVLYTLQIGKEVEGEDKAIEIGNPSGSTTDEEPAETEQAAIPQTETTQQVSQTGNQDVEAAEEDEDGKNRYLMIRVAFDESLLGDRPVEPSDPVKPTAPDGYVPPSAEEGKISESDGSTESNQPDSAIAETQNEDAVPPPDEQPERDASFVKFDQELADYGQQKIEFELGLTRYEQDIKEREQKIEAGKKLVEELNERFGDWYYVVTADNLKTLQTTRADLVNSKEKEPGEVEEKTADPDLPTKPDISFPESDLDEVTEPESSQAGTEANPEGG